MRDVVLLFVHFDRHHRPALPWRSGAVKYPIRIPSNDSLERDIAELLTRPVGRPSYKPVVLVKEPPLPGGELEDSATGGG